MANEASSNVPKVKLEDGLYRIVFPVDRHNRYKSLVLLALNLAPQKSAAVKDLQTWTAYRNYSQFKTTVIQKLHDQGLVKYDSETGDVSITPPGVLFAINQWPELFGRQ